MAFDDCLQRHKLTFDVVSDTGQCSVRTQYELSIKSVLTQYELSTNSALAQYDPSTSSVLTQNLLHN